MLDWFRRLMPREQLFFPLFERHARVLSAGAVALRQMLEGGEQIQGHCQSVMRHEEEADAITRDVLIGVRTTFITPFDRGDIQGLITGADRAAPADVFSKSGWRCAKSGIDPAPYRIQTGSQSS